MPTADFPPLPSRRPAPHRRRLPASNLLEGLPWESVPPGPRIALNPDARFARAARAAHRGKAA